MNFGKHQSEPRLERQYSNSVVFPEIAFVTYSKLSDYLYKMADAPSNPEDHCDIVNRLALGSPTADTGRLKRPTVRASRALPTRPPASRDYFSVSSPPPEEHQPKRRKVISISKSTQTDSSITNPIAAIGPSPASDKQAQSTLSVEEISDPDASSDEDESSAIDVELFGLDSDWMTVMEGARSLPEVSASKLPKLNTAMIRSIIHKIIGAKKLFHSLKDSSDSDVEDLETRLADHLSVIKEEIEDLDESAFTRKTATDIYAYAIPQLVYLLESALHCWSWKYSSPDDFSYLKSIIRMQDFTLILCKKVRECDKKPLALAELPIIKPTSAKILPYLRKLRKGFSQELRSRQDKVMHRNRQLANAKSHEKLFEKQALEREENERKRREINLKIHEDLKRNQAMLFGLNDPAEMLSRQFSKKGSVLQGSPSAWSRDEDFELLLQLQNPDSRHLPGKTLSLLLMSNVF